MTKFLSGDLNELQRIQLVAELASLREERRKRIWDGGHTVDDLRFISGWIQALEWILGEPYSEEPAPESYEEATHWRWEIIEAKMQNRPVKTAKQLHDEFMARGIVNH